MNETGCLCYNRPCAMSKVYRSSEFFRALPADIKPRLPRNLQKYHTRLRNWMLQVYYGDYAVHYEASAYQRLNVFEVGLHFERRGRDHNDALMQQFVPYVFEIKAELGPQVEFERWDKGWSKSLCGYYERRTGNFLFLRISTENGKTTISISTGSDKVTCDYAGGASPETLGNH